MAEKNSEQPTATSTQRPGEAKSGLDRVRAAAAKDSTLRLNNVMHHLNEEMLAGAYQALNPNAAVGVDRVSWADYGEGLEGRLADLHERLQKGRYRPQHARRIMIPKADGRKRPIGIQTLEDKIVQRAVGWVLEAIWENDFAQFSHGFRPGHNPHNALDAVWVGITERKISWILDADIRSFFDTLDHQWLMKFVERRVADQRLLKVIEYGLKAGVVTQEGQCEWPQVGVPQGSVLSPILANIYLHYVLDEWIAQWRKEEAKGDVIVVRYADDFVMGFQYKAEAERCLKEMKERFERHGLQLHEEKTRLIEFGRFAQKRAASKGSGKPETFNFLGFTHICARRRSDGQYTIRRETIAKRMRAKLTEIGEELMRIRHISTADQGEWLGSVLRGYFNYHAVPDNLVNLDRFRSEVTYLWKRALNRCSQKAKTPWTKMKRLAELFLPKVKRIHPYPNQRLRVARHSRQEPYAVVPHVRICAGGAQQ